jgi:hypothetical protein
VTDGRGILTLLQRSIGQGKSTLRDAIEFGLRRVVRQPESGESDADRVQTESTNCLWFSLHPARKIPGIDFGEKKNEFVIWL